MGETNNTGMHMMTKQSGKTRVNIVKEGQKNKRVKSTKQRIRGTQLLDQRITSYQKVLDLQKSFLQEGMTVSEYKKYVQDKINRGKYHYKRLSKEDIENLYSNYGKLCQKDYNQYNLVEEERKMKRKQRKNFREQRSSKMNGYKRQLIQKTFTELDKIPPGRGIVKTTHLSTDPKRWKETSNSLFTGGHYLLDSDKRWTSIYGKLSPMNSSALFDVVYGSDELKESYLKVY